MRIAITPLIIAAAMALSSCAPQNIAATPAPLTAKNAKLVEKLLKGKVAGKAVSCISNFRNQTALRISDDALLYRGGPNLVYRNQLRSSCPGLADDDDILIIRSFNAHHCTGDLIQLVDRYSGIPGPTCVLGDFVPYKSAKTQS